MFTRKLVTWTTSARVAPAEPRMSPMLSRTAAVCARMSRAVVPNSSTSAPANVLSGRRLLVPDTNTKSPARFPCGNRPRGVAFPSTVTASVITASLISDKKPHQPQTKNRGTHQCARLQGYGSRRRSGEQHGPGGQRDAVLERHPRGRGPRPFWFFLFFG